MEKLLLLGQVLAGAVPVTFIAIVIGRRLFPGIDPYLAKAKPVIAEIDDLLDVILLEWDNAHLRTVDDILGRIREDLRRAGYKLDGYEEEKVKNHARARLRRETEKPGGLAISRNDEGELVVSYEREL